MLLGRPTHRSPRRQLGLRAVWRSACCTAWPCSRICCGGSVFANKAPGHGDMATRGKTHEMMSTGVRLQSALLSLSLWVFWCSGFGGLRAASGTHRFRPWVLPRPVWLGNFLALPTQRIPNGHLEDKRTNNCRAGIPGVAGVLGLPANQLFFWGRGLRFLFARKRGKKKIGCFFRLLGVFLCFLGHPRQ